MTSLVKPKENESSELSRKEPSRRLVVPEYDIIAKEQDYEITVQMAGVGEADLELQVEGQALIAKGRNSLMEQEGFERVYSEFAPADYEVGFRLPNNIDAERITASINQGVLRIALPLAERQSKLIKVNAAYTIKRGPNHQQPQASGSSLNRRPFFFGSARTPLAPL